MTSRLKKLAEGLDYHQLMLQLADKMDQVAQITIKDSGYEEEKPERTVMYTPNGDGYPGSPGYQMYYVTIAAEVTRDTVQSTLNVTFMDEQWNEFTNIILTDCAKNDKSEFIKEIESYNALFSNKLHEAEKKFDNVDDTEITFNSGESKSDNNQFIINLDYAEYGYNLDE